MLVQPLVHLGTVGNGCYLVAFKAQIVAEQVAQPRVVVHHQQLLVVHSGPSPMLKYVVTNFEY